MGGGDVGKGEFQKYNLNNENHAVTKNNENMFITGKCDYNMLLSETRTSQNITTFLKSSM